MAHMRAWRANDRLLSRPVSVSKKPRQCSMQLRQQPRSFIVNRREFIWTSGAAVTAALAGTPAFAEGKPIKIGYNVATLANPFFQGMTKGVVDASSKTPGVTLLNTNANGDANTQSTMVVDLINQGVDALILNPINANAIVPVVQQAQKKGIPVFTLDRGASCGPCQVNFLRPTMSRSAARGRSTSS